MQPESKKQDEAEKKQYDVSHSHDTMGETLVCGICQVLWNCDYSQEWLCTVIVWSADRGIHLRELYYERCLLMRDVYLWEMSTYERCLHIWEMSAYEKCLLMRDVSTYERCLLMRNVYLWEMSTYERCLLMKDMSTYERCQLMRDVNLWEMSTYERCLLMRDVYLWEMSTYERCLLMKDVYLWEICLLMRDMSTVFMKGVFLRRDWCPLNTQKRASCYSPSNLY